MNPPQSAYKATLSFSQASEQELDELYSNSETDARQNKPSIQHPSNRFLRKVVLDSVHGIIPVSNAALAVIDTPEFQRLRDLKQLGTTSFVFPSATHTRFEHSLGVANLSNELIHFLQSHQSSDVNISSSDIKCVEIAGLCHDLGHGPFSHVFDGYVIPKLLECKGLSGSITFHHEDMSLQLFDYLVESNNLHDHFNKHEVKLIKTLIYGNKSSTVPSHLDIYDNNYFVTNKNSYLMEIVSNPFTGIDTDKFDYIARDPYALGLKTSFDFKRLLRSSRIMTESGYRIGYHHKEAYDVYELFHTRHRMFRTVYTHKASKAVEMMVGDALIAANDTFNNRFLDAITNPKEYAQLTDCVLREIESSNLPSLLPAQKIIKNLRARKLYRMVYDILLKPEFDFQRLPKLTEHTLIGESGGDPSVRLSPSDFLVHELILDYGMKKANPVDACLFYDSSNPNFGYQIKRSDVSWTMPNQFMDRWIRIYSKTDDEAKIKTMIAKVRSWARRHNASASSDLELLESDNDTSVSTFSVPGANIIPSHSSLVPTHASTPSRHPSTMSIMTSVERQKKFLNRELSGMSRTSSSLSINTSNELFPINEADEIEIVEDMLLPSGNVGVKRGKMN
jgi:deoxynucleoside triphosphate triphosphohydrolase SAMHD1